MLHSWEVLQEIINSEVAQDIVCDVGMCVWLPFSLAGHWHSHVNPHC